MSGEQAWWGSDWAVGVRVWAERAGHAILGKGRLELLEGIERSRSISAAARQMGMSYRRAWLLVQSINDAAGEALVEAATGGVHGGGARLTSRGRQAVAVFRELQDRLFRTAASSLHGLVQGSGTPTVHVAAAVSLEEVLGQLLTEFALQHPAVRVRAVFGASDELADHLLGGAPGDLFLTADVRQLDRLDAAELLVPDSRKVLAVNSLAVVGRGDGTLTVRKAADLAGPGIERIALADPASPLGGYTRSYLDGLGLYQTLLARAIVLDSSRSVLAAVRSGQADVGLVYGSDARSGSGCRVLFRVRRGVPNIDYVGALISRTAEPERARTFLEFLASKPAASRFRHCGFTVPPS
jgi:molybdenum ABC transporter molybdate-binding protein